MQMRTVVLHIRLLQRQYEHMLPRLANMQGDYIYDYSPYDDYKIFIIDHDDHHEFSLQRHGWRIKFLQIRCREIQIRERHVLQIRQLHKCEQSDRILLQRNDCQIHVLQLRIRMHRWGMQIPVLRLQVMPGVKPADLQMRDRDM